MNQTNIIIQLLTFQNQIKILHWQESGPGSYARHIAYDEFYDILTSKTDDFVECLQGKYGSILKFTENPSQTNILNNNLLKPVDFLNRYYKYLSDDIYNENLLTDNDLDLQDIILDILNGINKLKYKITFLQ